MEYHRGRLFDHVHLRVGDLEWSRRFYQAALGALGLEIQSGEGHFFSDELWVSADGPPTANLHLAFSAEDEEAVKRFHAAAIAAGGKDNGAPGERDYHPGYYGGLRPRPGREQRRGRVPRAGPALGPVGRHHAALVAGSPGGDARG